MIFGKKAATDKFDFLKELSEETKDALAVDLISMIGTLKTEGERFYKRWGAIVEPIVMPLIKEAPTVILKAQLGTIATFEDFLDSQKSPELESLIRRIVAKAEEIVSATETKDVS